MERLKSDLIIRGEQIYLRPITMDDTDMVVAWRNRKEVVENYIYREPVTVKDHINWLENKVNKGLVHQFIVCLREDDRPVGCVYLQHIDNENKKAESGIFMGPDCAKGKGIGTEAVRLLKSYAFDELKLHKVMARVLAYNIASLKLHENAGYTREACLRDELFLDGKYEDLVLFGAINPNQLEEV